jgi:hypothetical protein
LNASLAPTYNKCFGDYWVLWYSQSNRYSIVTEAFKTLLDDYFNTKSRSLFKAIISREASQMDSDSIINSIETYLKDCNQTTSALKDRFESIDTSNKHILKYYRFRDITFAIYVDSETVLNLIHPALAHLSTTATDTIDTTFDVYVKDDLLYLFKDEQLLTSVPKKDYHFIQGKFIMHLLCTIHNKQEEDWIGTFHGSTLTDGLNSILFIGESGKGKSTLCALLAHNGFDLLADDVSPMLSGTASIHHNPLALSIKAGAFKVLEPMVDGFGDLPTVTFNKSKGPIKYVSCPPPNKDHYPCKAIVLVNYQDNSDTQLEELSIKTILETLIPDSWLSPNPRDAKQFLDWLETVNLYQLTYSDTDSVTREVSKVFKTFCHRV